MGDLKGSKPTRQNTTMGDQLQASTEKTVPVVVHDTDDGPPPVDFNLDDGLTVLYYDHTPSSTDSRKGSKQKFSQKRAIVILRDFIQSKISPSAAAIAFLDLLPDLRDYVNSGAAGNAAHGEHWGLATFLVDMATQIPYNHPAQAKLVQLIERISDSDNVGGMEQLSIHLYETFGGKYSFSFCAWEKKNLIISHKQASASSTTPRANSQATPSPTRSISWASSPGSARAARKQSTLPTGSRQCVAVSR